MLRAIIALVVLFLLLRYGYIASAVFDSVGGFSW